MYQNVRITEAFTVIPERLRTPVAVIVTMESYLAGFVLRGQPAQECQLHVHLDTDAALNPPAGWMVDTPPSQTVRSAGRCVSTGLQAAVNGQQTSKWEIVVHIMCTILVVHLFVISVIVALTEDKVQVK